MPSLAAHTYVDGFVARWNSLRQPGQELVDRPGLHGLVPTRADAPARLVVDDDYALDAVRAALTPAAGGTVDVLDTAPRCRALLEDLAGWQHGTATVMSLPDLEDVAPAALPAGLAVRTVRLGDDDPADGVPLLDAVALAELADPQQDDSETGRFVEHLLSQIPHVRLLAAVDGEGRVRATSGAGVFGRYAHVLFVNTDPGWQRRGVGRAMTTHALLDAAGRGAGAAYLNASADGAGVYARLGFRPAGDVARFSRHS